MALRNAPTTRRFHAFGAHKNATLIDGCEARGLRLVVPRSRAHFGAMLARYGFRYFRIVPGVYGTTPGDYTKWPMNSASPHVASKWRAIDGGSWWLRDTPYAQPSGNYIPGCWLGLLDPLFGTDAAVSDPNERYRALAPADANTSLSLLPQLQFDDNECAYNADDYICSTNDKDPTVPFATWLAELPATSMSGVLQPPGEKFARPGKYKITYSVRNSRHISQCTTVSRIVIVSRSGI